METAVFQHVFLVTALPAEPGLTADGVKRCHTSDKNLLDDLAGLRCWWHFLHQVGSSVAERSVRILALHLGHRHSSSSGFPLCPGRAVQAALSHVHSPAAAGPQLAGAVCSVLPLQGEALWAKTGREITSVPETIHFPMQIAYCNDQIIQIIT